MQNLDGSETLQLQSFIERPKRRQHFGVIREWKRRMKSTHNVKFSDSQRQRLPRHFDDLLGGILESVGVAFLSGKGAELAVQDAVIRVIDVAIDDVAGPPAILALAGSAGQSAQRIDFFALEQPQH